MDSNIFNQAFNRAAMLMNDPKFNSIVESKAKKGSGMKSKGSSNEFSHLEAQAFGTPASYTQPIQETATPQNAITPSFLPSAIRESFSLNRPTMEAPQTVINEVQTYNPYTHQSQTINYDIIKALIDESISRHINEIKQSLITESNNGVKAVKVGEGNKIAFLDKHGNLYEGVLKLTKKAKK